MEHLQGNLWLKEEASSGLSNEEPDQFTLSSCFATLVIFFKIYGNVIPCKHWTSVNLVCLKSTRGIRVNNLQSIFQFIYLKKNQIKPPPLLYLELKLAIPNRI